MALQRWPQAVRSRPDETLAGLNRNGAGDRQLLDRVNVASKPPASSAFSVVIKASGVTRGYMLFDAPYPLGLHPLAARVKFSLANQSAEAIKEGRLAAAMSAGVLFSIWASWSGIRKLAWAIARSSGEIGLLPLRHGSALIADLEWSDSG